MRENTEKYLNFAVPVEKKTMTVDKNEEKITKNISYMLQLLKVQDLCQAHYHILSIISLKELIKLTVNTDTMIKNLT